MKGGQQALLARWTTAETESRQSREEVVRLVTALAARDAEVAARRGADHGHDKRHGTVVVENSHGATAEASMSGGGSGSGETLLHRMTTSPLLA